jgi:hypothetical protein
LRSDANHSALVLVCTCTLKLYTDRLHMCAGTGVHQARLLLPCHCILGRTILVEQFSKLAITIRACMAVQCSRFPDQIERTCFQYYLQLSPSLHFYDSGSPHQARICVNIHHAGSYALFHLSVLPQTPTIRYEQHCAGEIMDDLLHGASAALFAQAQLFA